MHGDVCSAKQVPWLCKCFYSAELNDLLNGRHPTEDIVWSAPACTPTQNTIQQQIWVSSLGTCYYWTRTMGGSSPNYVVLMKPDGTIHDQGVFVAETIAGIRPAMWVNLNP